MVIALDVKKAGGRLIHVARPGQALFPGTLIARLDDQGDNVALRPVDFEGVIDEWRIAEEKRRAADVRLTTRFANVKQATTDILNGYAVPEALFEANKKALM